MHRYATEIVANHFVNDFASTLMMDMHADSGLSTQEVSGKVQLSQAGESRREIRTPMVMAVENCRCLPGCTMIVGKLGYLLILQLVLHGLKQADHLTLPPTWT